MAAKTSEMCLLGAMDSLWFRHVILFSKRSMLVLHETPKMPLPTSESPDHSSKNSSQISVISEQEFSSITSVTNGSQDETSEKRPTRLNLAPTKTKSHSSSSSVPHEKTRKSKHRHYPASGLQKTTSLKSLEELELEEVKGFMDLGFTFKGEKLSKHLVRLIPGLQRIDGDGGPAAGDEDDDDDNDDDIEEESTGVVMRPYLSEAWLVKSGGGDDCESPVASRVCTAVDMKMRLRYWARKVAMAVQRDL